jgi:hypothetical protein
MLRLARRWLPYPGKDHTPDEEPLRQRHLRELETVFDIVDVEGYQLLTMLRRVVARSRLRSVLERQDGRLLGRWPSLQRYCRYVVLTLRRTDLPPGRAP